MAYTSANLTSVQTAILALATGDLVASVSINGKLIEYGKADISKLETLRSNIIADLNGSTVNVILIKTSKGL